MFGRRDRIYVNTGSHLERSFLNGTIASQHDHHLSEIVLRRDSIYLWCGAVGESPWARGRSEDGKGGARGLCAGDRRLDAVPHPGLLISLC